jgi:hypothetical protein
VSSAVGLRFVRIAKRGRERRRRGGGIREESSRIFERGDWFGRGGDIWVPRHGSRTGALTRDVHPLEYAVHPSRQPAAPGPEHADHA